MGLLDAIRQAQAAFDTRAPLPELDASGRRVLIAYLFPRLGDAVLLAPAVRALFDAAPEVEVDLLLRPLAARVWKTIDLPVKIHVFDDACLEREPRDTPLFARLKKRKFDVALDLTRRAEVDARAWVQALEATTTGGWIDPDEDIEALGFTYGVLDRRVQTDTHWSRYCAQVLEPFGVEEPNFDVTFRWTKKAEQTAARAFRAPGPRLLIVPGSQDPEKVWPKTRFIGIGRRAKAEHDASIVVAGAPWEAELIEQIAGGISEHAQTYTGRDLGTMAALVDACDLLLANDTGPTHIGFLMERVVVAVFTEMAPAVWGPHREDERFCVLRPPDGSQRAELDDEWIEFMSGVLDPFLKKARGSNAQD